jgi:hypothetical protein
MFVGANISRRKAIAFSERIAAHGSGVCERGTVLTGFRCHAGTADVT